MAIIGHKLKDGDLDFGGAGNWRKIYGHIIKYNNEQVAIAKVMYKSPVIKEQFF